MLQQTSTKSTLGGASFVNIRRGVARVAILCAVYSSSSTCGVCAVFAWIRPACCILLYYLTLYVVTMESLIRYFGKCRYIPTNQMLPVKLAADAGYLQIWTENQMHFAFSWSYRLKKYIMFYRKKMKEEFTNDQRLILWKKFEKKSRHMVCWDTHHIQYYLYICFYVIFFVIQCNLWQKYWFSIDLYSEKILLWKYARTWICSIYLFNFCNLIHNMHSNTKYTNNMYVYTFFSIQYIFEIYTHSGKTN